MTDLALLSRFVDAALAHYELGADVSYELINLSENATYRVVGPGGKHYALRIHREGYHSREAIASELSWLMALRQDGVVTTPVPLSGRDGELIQPVTVDGASRHAVLSAWEAGREPGVGEDLSSHFATLGEVTARMHLHANAWQRPAGFIRHVWTWETALGDEAPHWGRWREGLGMDEPKRDLFGHAAQLVRQRLEAFGNGPKEFGLAHCDLRLANLLVDGDAVKVLDFDDCGFSWYLYDAATPVSFYEHFPQVPGLIRNWLSGYRRVVDLGQREEDEIPTFLMLRRLLLVAWIGSHRETELAQSMGVEYTAQTVDLARDYLKRMD